MGIIDETGLVLEKFKTNFNNIIIDWYNMSGRQYIWRKNRNPYKILISEIFLQRTIADQVEPVYLDFLKRFPEPKYIKSSSKDEISEFMKKLGLLKRTEVILKVFSEINKMKKGRIPDIYEDLISLPGIGLYIASATLCFGFNKKKAILDTNVARIYSRVFNIHPKTKTAKNDKFLWQFCENMLPYDHYVEFNYGLLDLGGLICTAKKPRCTNCPVNKMCWYYELKINNQ